MAEKKTRKELLKKDDAFLAAAGQGAVWLKHHRILVVAGAAALALVIGGTWIGIKVNDERRLDASSRFTAALALKNAEIAAEPSKADPSAAPPTWASKEERDKKAREAFGEVAANAPAGVAQLARFYAAGLDAELGRDDAALAELRALADELSPEDSLFFLAVEGAAHVLERKGDSAGAIATWQQLVGSGKRFYADHALYQLARLRAQGGDNDQARELLGRIEKDFPSSSVLPKVEELYTKVGRPQAAAATQGAAAEEPKGTP